MPEHLQREADERAFLREQLAADVAIMRQLGVERWHNIVLGIAPNVATEPPSESKIDPDEQFQAMRRAQYENLFNRPVADEELSKLP